MKMLNKINFISANIDKNMQNKIVLSNRAWNSNNSMKKS